MTRATISLLILVPILCVYAIPLPEPFGPGDVVVVKPSNVPGSQSTSTQRHPAVVLDHANAANEHKIALISSNLPNPPHSGTGTASLYHPGLKGDISLHPLTASAAHLESSNKVSSAVDGTKLSQLKTDIYNNCGQVVRRSDGQLVRRGRGASCAMRKTVKPAKHTVAKSASQKGNHNSVSAQKGLKRPTTSRIHKTSSKSKVTGAHKQIKQKKGKTVHKPAARRPAAHQKKPRHK